MTAFDAVLYGTMGLLLLIAFGMLGFLVVDVACEMLVEIKLWRFARRR